MPNEWQKEENIRGFCIFHESAITHNLNSQQYVEARYISIITDWPHRVEPMLNILTSISDVYWWPFRVLEFPPTLLSLLFANFLHYISSKKGERERVVNIFMRHDQKCHAYEKLLMFTLYSRYFYYSLNIFNSNAKWWHQREKKLFLCVFLWKQLISFHGFCIHKHVKWRAPRVQW